MASFLREVSRLTDQQLRAKLNSLGEAVGPIVPSLRPLFENRLVKYFFGDKNNEETTESQECPQIYAAGASLTVHNGTSNANLPPAKSEQFQVAVALPLENPARDQNSPTPDSDTDSRPTSTSTRPNVGSSNLKKDVAGPVGTFKGSKITEDDCEPTIYYGVGLPEDADVETDKLVFTHKDEVMKLIKKIKGARFKHFPTFEEAEAFSKEAQASLIAAANSPPPKRSDKNQSVIVDNSGMAAEFSVFKAPCIQELVKLRKAIEAGDLDAVHNLIWCNPRYLISGGDTPTILQVPFRYNALHVTGMKNQPEICGMIVDTLEDPKFMELLYPQETEESRLKRIDFIVDLYLNTPDKGNWENALHFASKFGNVEVVSILASHPTTDKRRLNKYGESAAVVCCSRAKNQSLELQQQIQELLQEHFFVPLFRTADNVSQPVIGEPWSPDLQNSRSQQMPGSPMPKSPRDPTFSVKAYAGPMSPNQAEKFRKDWCTPPPRGRSPDAKWYHNVKRSDGCKGIERIGRSLAAERKIPWTEYWEFLECFADLTSSSGLHKLEKYLKEKAISVAIEQTLSKETPVGEDDEDIDSPIRGKLNYSDGDIDIISSKFDNLTIHSPLASPIQNLSKRVSANCKTTDVNRVDSSNGAGEGDGFCFEEDDNTVVKQHTHSDSNKDLSEDTGKEEEGIDLADGVNSSPDCRTKRRAYFITGLHPSKVDMDVLRVLEAVSVKADKYPAICRWKALVLSYSNEAKQSWPSPAVLERRLSRTAPGPRRSLPVNVQIRPSHLSSLSEKVKATHSLQNTRDKQVNLRDVQKNLMAKFME